MKLRIKDSTIRIRLSQQEVLMLEENGVCSSQCIFSTENILQYCIQKNIENDWSVSFLNNNIEVKVPTAVLDKFFDESEIGFDHEFSNGSSGLYLLIEKDFQCLTPRPHEDETDLFPNPNVTC